MTKMRIDRGILKMLLLPRDVTIEQKKMRINRGLLCFCYAEFVQLHRREFSIFSLNYRVELLAL